MEKTQAYFPNVIDFPSYRIPSSHARGKGTPLHLLLVVFHPVRHNRLTPARQTSIVHFAVEAQV